MAEPRLKLINRKLGTKYRSIAAAWDDLELPFMFAGREQYVRNLSGQTFGDELANVTMVSLVHGGKQPRSLFAGRLQGHTNDASRDHLNYWRSLVPAWAEEIRAELEDYEAPTGEVGIPFSVELIADPNINISGTGPLFEKGDWNIPRSLFPLGALQAGERGFLRNLTIRELFLEVYPPFYRYYHRGPGQPVPPDLVAGLSFGSPVYVGKDSPFADASGFVRCALVETDAYRRWEKAGAPD